MPGLRHKKTDKARKTHQKYGKFSSRHVRLASGTEVTTGAGRGAGAGAVSSKRVGKKGGNKKRGHAKEYKRSGG